MTVLLIGINAKYIHSNPAIYSLKAYADKYYLPYPNDCVLEIAEYTINQLSSTILADIYQNHSRECDLGKVLRHSFCCLFCPQKNQHDIKMEVCQYWCMRAHL